MAVPKRRTSKAKKHSRRGHIKIAKPGLSVCNNCSAIIASHSVCDECGFYKGLEVVKTDEV